MTLQFLKCFEQQYEIIKLVESEYKGIDRIAELLWAFSTTEATLSSKNDQEYRKLIESNIKVEILNLLDSFKAKIPAIEQKKLCELCNDVFGGKKFDDKCLNAFIGRVIATARS